MDCRQQRRKGVFRIRPRKERAYYSGKKSQIYIFKRMGLISLDQKVDKSGMRILFWNTRDNDVTLHASGLVQHYLPDTIILAESETYYSDILQSINASSPLYNSCDRYNCDRIRVLNRDGTATLALRSDGPKMVMYECNISGKPSFLLVAVHLASKWKAKEDDQAAECEDLARLIESIEEKDIKHDRTVVVGDLNQNPFERGVASARGLHAVVSAKKAARLTRKHNGNKYKMFYNPMWNLYGDFPPGPPATYYYDGSGNTELFWHMFDQVLLRPDMIPFFNASSLRILDGYGDVSLLNKSKIPQKDSISDHLPIMFDLF